MTPFSVNTGQSQITWNGFPLSDIFSFLSLLIVAFAAWQALKSARAAAQANMQSMLPVLTLKYVADGNQLTGHVLLRNIGRGHAFNISSLTYMSFFSDRGYRYSKLTLDAVPNDLKRDEELTMTAWVYEAGKVVKDRTIGGVMTMLTVDGGERRKVPIFYTDVAGNRYVTYLETGARRVRIIQPSRRFGVKERCRYGLYRVRESLTFFYYSMRRAHYGFSNRE